MKVENKVDKILEQEFTFIIPRESLKITPKELISSFKLENIEHIEIDDILFDRKNVSLSDEKIGVRFRKQNKHFEFTYKKFLGRINNAAQYDEYTTAVSEADFNNARLLVYDKAKVPILESLKEKGDFFLMLEIKNNRTVYHFSNGKDRAILMLEDVQYSNTHKQVSDANIEIEVYTTDLYKKELNQFVDEIKDKFLCKDMNEGKNSRGLALLDA